MNENVDSSLILKLSKAFLCTNIDNLSFNMNQFNWLADLDETFGDLKFDQIRVRNISAFKGDIKAGAFTHSKHLKSFVIEPSRGNNEASQTIATDAFKGLRQVHTIMVGNHFSKIETMAFQNLRQD